MTRAPRFPAAFAAIAAAAALALGAPALTGAAHAQTAPVLSDAFQPQQSFTAQEARRDAREGRIVRLSTVFAELEQRFGGYQLGAELHGEGRARTYVIRWMAGDGRVLDIRADARTGRIADVSG